MTVADLDALEMALNDTSTWPPTDDEQFDTPSPRTDYNQSISFVTADQQQAYDQTLPALHWNPAIEPPILGFEPTFIQDAFDPFTFTTDFNFGTDFDFNVDFDFNTLPGSEAEAKAKANHKG